MVEVFCSPLMTWQKQRLTELTGAPAQNWQQGSKSKDEILTEAHRCVSKADKTPETFLYQRQDNSQYTTATETSVIVSKIFPFGCSWISFKYWLFNAGRQKKLTNKISKIYIVRIIMGRISKPVSNFHSKTERLIFQKGKSFHFSDSRMIVCLLICY